MQDPPLLLDGVIYFKDAHNKLMMIEKNEKGTFKYGIYMDSKKQRKTIQAPPGKCILKACSQFYRSRPSDGKIVKN